MQSEPHFATDLYRGTAEYYDRYRLTYPRILTEDLAGRVRPSGHGLLLDLACGTGQLAFALHTSFAETWAVDQEPDMVRLVAAKAARAAKAERAKIRPTASSAEDLSAPAATFELITIGNAFHRLHGQKALGEVLDRWRSTLGARDRVPPG
jgi:ubiquinone/menaquinone biosynthesis C-methylase UbiE